MLNHSTVAQLRERVLKGIPDSVRGEVWKHLTRSSQLKTSHQSGTYKVSNPPTSSPRVFLRWLVSHLLRPLPRLCSSRRRPARIRSRETSTEHFRVTFCSKTRVVLASRSFSTF